MGPPGKKRAERRREPPLAGESQQYARVTAMLGNNRVKAMFWDKTERLCRIRGSMRRREWVHVGDVVLVSLRDELSSEAADIIFRYQPAEVHRLRKLGEPVHILCDEEEAQMDELITFEGGQDEESPAAFGGTGKGELPYPVYPADDEDFDLEDI